MPEETFVIAGASLAGAKAAETLREEGFAGRVLLIGDEIERPYERPPLSKGFLLDREPREKAHVHEADWYDKHDVELRLGTTVAAIDRGAHRCGWPAGSRSATTGCCWRRVRPRGGWPCRAPSCRASTTCGRWPTRRALRQALAPGGRRVVVAGAGWIGLETAAAARSHGNEVTIIEPEPTPLHAVMGPELGGCSATCTASTGSTCGSTRASPGSGARGRCRRSSPPAAPRCPRTS